MDRELAVQTLEQASLALRVNLQPRMAERVDNVIDYVKGGSHEVATDGGHADNKDNAAERGDTNERSKT